MRTVQEIFDLAIKKGFYDNSFKCFMCFSVDDLLNHEWITDEEHYLARSAIGHVLNGRYALHALFESTVGEDAPHSSTEKVRLAMYQDWANAETIAADFIKEYVK